MQTDQALHLSGHKSWYSCLAKTLRSAGIKDNIKFIDSETNDKKLTEFYIQQTKDLLEKLKVKGDSQLKLYSSIFSFKNNIPNYLKLNLKQPSRLVLL